MITRLISRPMCSASCSWSGSEYMIRPSFTNTLKTASSPKVLGVPFSSHRVHSALSSVHCFFMKTASLCCICSVSKRPILHRNSPMRVCSTSQANIVDHHDPLKWTRTQQTTNNKQKTSNLWILVSVTVVVCHEKRAGQPHLLLVEERDVGPTEVQTQTV